MVNLNDGLVGSGVVLIAVGLGMLSLEAMFIVLGLSLAGTGLWRHFRVTAPPAVPPEVVEPADNPAVPGGDRDQD